MISHYLNFLIDVPRLISCTPLNAKSLNFNHEIDSNTSIKFFK